MSGIIPPSILTLQYMVDPEFKRYVNLSFPYRVKIESVWFTADDNLSGAGPDEGSDPWVLERVLRLGAVKQRNAKRPTSSGDAPSDLNLLWAPNYNWYGDGSPLVTNDKPAIWFGNPDNREEVEDTDAATPEQEVQYDDWHDTEVNYRSTARPLPSTDKMSYWFNYGWDSNEFGANKYKTDLSIMNPDEFVSLFLYPDGGDWSTFVGIEGLATIFVQYTGVASAADSNPTRIWD